jgi:hypothetical protein
MTATPERVRHPAAEQQPAYGRGQDNQREGDGEKVQGDEGQYCEADEE